MKKRIFFILLAIVLAISVGLIGCAGEQEEEEEEEIPPAPDSVVVGASRSQTGIWGIFKDAIDIPVLEQFVDMWNAEGGILLDAYGPDYRVPIELIIYDDMSDPGKCAENTIRLIVEDEVDFLWGGTGTSMVFAQAPVSDDYGMVLMTLEGGATQIKEELIYEMPYLFVHCGFSDWYQLPILAPVLADEGVETAFIAYIDTEHGWEYRGVAEAEFAKVGIEVVDTFPMAPDFLDFPAVISAAEASGADFFASYSSAPPQNQALAEAAVALAYNPGGFMMGPGGDWGFMGLALGEAIEGVMCFTVANREVVIPGASMPMADLYDMIEGTAGYPMWSPWLHPQMTPCLEIWKEAVEAVGYVDQEALREELARRGPDDPFTTVLGPMWYTMFGDGGGLMAYEAQPGQIGQWQGGIVQTIGYENITDDIPGYVITADFIYPKPPWPTP